MNKEIEKYTYTIKWSEEDKIHIGKCLEFPSLSAHGHTMDKALHEIKKVVYASIKWMRENNESIPESFSSRKFKGNLTLRVPAEIHRELTIKSAEEGVSINKYILSKII